MKNSKSRVKSVSSHSDKAWRKRNTLPHDFIRSITSLSIGSEVNPNPNPTIQCLRTKLVFFLNFYQFV